MAACLVLLDASKAISRQALPGTAEAMKVATAWLSAVAGTGIPATLRVSAYPFRALGFESPNCKGDKTARDESALRAFIQCVQQDLVTEETKGDLGKGDLSVLDAKALKSPGWKDQRAHLRGLTRDERLLWRIYQDEDILHVVVLGVRTTPDGPRVTSFTYHIDTLGDE